MNTFPGINHGYEANKTFYTLCDDKGHYLSHPGMYANHEKPKEFDSIKHIGADDFKRCRSHSEGALTQHWYCAWVVYSVEELRALYKALVPSFPDRRPLHPCQGEFIAGEHGITTVHELHKMTKAELATLKKTHPPSRQQSMKRHPKTITQLKITL